MKKSFFIFAIVVGMTLVSCGGGAEKDKTDESADELIEEAKAPKEEQETEEPVQQEKVNAQPTVEVDEGEEKAKSSISQYFQGLNEAQYTKASQAFAPEVAQWITIKNTNPEDIAKEAQRFLSTKQSVHYQMHLSTFVYHKDQNTGEMVVSQDWKDYHAILKILLAFDANGKITSYKEGDILEYNHTNGDLFGYLQSSKKLTLPLEVHFDNGYRKKMTRERAKFFGESVAAGFNDRGYFDLPNGLVGVLKEDLMMRGNATYLYIIKKSSGKILSMQVVSGTHVGLNHSYYQHFSTISPNGWITTNMQSSEGDHAPKVKEIIKYMITPDGKIKQL